MTRKQGSKNGSGRKTAKPSMRATLGRGNAVTHVYETVRAEILSLKLAPGEDIDDAELCDRLGLSRTPIREALARLAGDGLVTQSPNRGYQVAPVDLMETPRFAEALSLLQRAVMRTAALRRTPKDLEQIEQAYRSFVQAVGDRSPVSLTLSNRAFHVAIAEACHNRYLADAYTRLLDQGMRMLSVPFAYDPGPDDSVSEHTQRVDEDHRAMIEVIRARDAERADALGAEHAELFRSRFIAYMERNLLARMDVSDAGTTASSGRGAGPRRPAAPVTP
ncbi:MAG: GntR family transcriptional regulator [Lautropia sp.]